MVNLLDKSSKQKVEAEDTKFLRLSKKVHLITGPVFKLWSLAEDRDDKEMIKFAKKSVLAVGQLQLGLNHERRMLSYGELCRDHKRAKEHLKEASSSFGKVAKRSGKPSLFGDKFKRAVIDRGPGKKNSCVRRRRSLSGNPRGSFSLRRRRLAVVHLHMLRLCNRFRTPSPSRAISPSPFRGTPPRNPKAGVGDRGMSAPVVKGLEVGCTVLTTDAHFVPGAELRKELTKESSSLTLQEEFLSMANPPEFQHLGLLDCQAPDQVGGRVSWYVQNCEKIVQDPWVLSVVRTGYRIEWLSRPSQSAATLQSTFSQDMNLLVDTEVQEMLLKGAIEEVVPVPGQYVSSIFSVSKKDGGSRPVINLKQLNHLVLYEHFQMEGLGTLLNSVAAGEFLTKLDLKDAYFTLPIHQADRTYLRFRWGGKLYQFRVLPFGLS